MAQNSIPKKITLNYLLLKHDVSDTLVGRTQLFAKQVTVLYYIIPKLVSIHTHSTRVDMRFFLMLCKCNVNNVVVMQKGKTNTSFYSFKKIKKRK